jgi:hypothetical protein
MLKRVGSITATEMKKMGLFVLVSTSLFAFAQPKDHEMTILEKLFSVESYAVYKIVEEKDNTRRELVFCKSKDENSFKKYVLTEFGYEDMVTGSAYIVSKDYFPDDKPLYNITLGKELVINIDKLNKPEDNNYQGKMTVKLREELIDATDRFQKIVNKVDEGDTTEICLDHWWVTCKVETREPIEIEYLGSDCYTFGSGTGGSNCCGRSAEQHNMDLSKLAFEQDENTISAIDGTKNVEDVFINTAPLPVGFCRRIQLTTYTRLAGAVYTKIQHPVICTELIKKEETRNQVQE